MARTKTRNKDEQKAFCQFCGSKLPELMSTAVICPMCGSDLPEFQARERKSAKRQARTAALLSLLVPGAGQVFNRQFFKGFLVLGTFWMIVPWIFGVIDAYFSASSRQAQPNAPGIL
jgi:predicted RNA-binding Zn-ribbon protein involved in translation (DUF1610 family)